MSPPGRYSRPSPKELADERRQTLRGSRTACRSSPPASWLAAATAQRAAASFTVDQILNLPQPDNLIASPVRSTIAWTFNERGVHNIYAADAPDFTPRRLTPYTDDDGQERRTLVFERRPDDGLRARRRPRNHARPRAQSGRPHRSAESAGMVGDDGGGGAKLLGEGDDPAIAPTARVALVRDRRLWIAPIDGSSRPGGVPRAAAASRPWSPDGRTFVSSRGDHSSSPCLHPVSRSTISRPTSRFGAGLVSDGHRIAFLRQPGTGGATIAHSSSSGRSGRFSWPNPIFIRPARDGGVTSGDTDRSHLAEPERHPLPVGYRRHAGLHVLS
jgi:hypothetical protein